MSTTKEAAVLSPPKDLSHLLSAVTRGRAASNIKQFYKYFSIPGIGQLAGGLPHPNYFPFDNLIADVALPNRFEPTPNDPVDPPLLLASVSKERSSSRLIVPHDAGSQDRNRNIDIASALQYGTASGYPPLREWLLRFVKEHMHTQIPYSGGPEIVLTCGSTDGFAKTVEAFNNIWVEDRDPIASKEGILVEEFAYMTAVQTARPRGMNVATVAIDDEGMCARGPGGLHEVLEKWDFSIGKRPHMLYTVTIGQNPTTGVLSIQRRKEIYALCSRYDIIIVEDDPYWFLQYPPASNQPLNTPASETGFPFLDSLVPSYLTIDTEGRVVRLDTFSKTIAPGCRLGWITAQPRFIERLERITEYTTQQPSGFVQSMVSELIIGPPPTSNNPNPSTPGRGGGANGQGFQPEGWVRWLEGLRGKYERRMTAMCDILDEGAVRAKAGRRPSLMQSIDHDDWTVIERDNAPLYSFQRPRGGMFVWIDVHFHAHPLWNKDGLTPQELSRALWVNWTRRPSLVLVSPGEIFAPTDEVRMRDGYRFFRLCFAPCREEEVVGLTRRFVMGIHRFWAIRNTRTIRDLLENDRAGLVDDEHMGLLQGFC